MYNASRAGCVLYLHEKLITDGPRLRFLVAKAPVVQISCHLLVCSHPIVMTLPDCYDSEDTSCLLNTVSKSRDAVILLRMPPMQMGMPYEAESIGGNECSRT